MNSNPIATVAPKLVGVLLGLAAIQGWASERGFEHDPQRSESRIPAAFQVPTISASEAAAEMSALALPSVDQLIALPFAGSYRKTAKTQMVSTGKIEEFKTVAALVQNLRDTQPEQRVRAEYSKAHNGADLGGTNDAPRIKPYETHRVAITGYIRAIKWEAAGDNDFHVMVCDSAIPNDGVCFTVEVSGVPPSASAAVKKAFTLVRKQLLDITGVLGFADRFVRPDTPPRVRVEGAIFLDGKHSAGVVGPTDAKSPTAYEIHPVNRIELAP